MLFYAHGTPVAGLIAHAVQMMLDGLAGWIIAARAVQHGELAC